MNDYSLCFAIHCKLLQTFSEGLPDSLFGKTFREVYVLFLANAGDDDWTQFIKVLNLLSAHELQTRMENTLSVLKSLPVSNSSTMQMSGRLFLFLEELRRLDKEQDDKQDEKEKQAFVSQGKKLNIAELRAVSIRSLTISCFIFAINRYLIIIES